jgi:hypothetical protein
MKYFKDRAERRRKYEAALKTAWEDAERARILYEQANDRMVVARSKVYELTRSQASDEKIKKAKKELEKASKRADGLAARSLKAKNAAMQLSNQKP